MASDQALEFYKRQHLKRREIVLAFGVDSNGDLESLSDASTLGSVSSFLPLVEERSGARYLIQGDFLVQPGREAIQYELSWNHWLLSEAAELAKSAIEEFKARPKWGGQFLPLFVSVDYSGQAAFDRLFKPRLHDKISEYLGNAEVHRAKDGTYVKTTDAAYLDAPLVEILNDTDLPFLFGAGTGLKIAGASSELSSLPSVTSVAASTVNSFASRPESWVARSESEVAKSSTLVQGAVSRACGVGPSIQTCPRSEQGTHRLL